MANSDSAAACKLRFCCLNISSSRFFFHHRNLRV